MGNQLKLCSDLEIQSTQVKLCHLTHPEDTEIDHLSLQLATVEKNRDPLRRFLQKTILPIKTFHNLNQYPQENDEYISAQDEIVRRIKKKTSRITKTINTESASEEQNMKYLTILEDEIEAIIKEKTENGYQIAEIKIDRQHLFKRLKINLGNFIRTSGQNIKDHYIFKECIGEGTYGRVFRAVCRKTKQERAIKILKKKNGIAELDTSNYLTQFQLLSQLDHPNIVKLYEIYFFKAHYYFVMEYCKGGSFIELIKKNKTFSEGTICCIMRQLLSAQAYLHKQGIAHRDIKLDNMVVLSSKSSQEGQFFIKLIDFGTAIKITSKKGKIAGTRFYMAPQAFRGRLNVKTDVWAAGVFMYVMIAGKFPFNANSFQGIQNEIKIKVVSFGGYQWKQISKQGKKLLMQMLERNPQKRLSATQALLHPWFEKNHVSSKKITYEQSNLSMLQKYQRGNNFIAVIEQYLCMKHISQGERDKLGYLFRKIDTNNDGVIEHKELVQICQEHFGVHTDNEVNRILEEIDHNGSGQIDFNEFLVAMYSRKRLFMQQSLIQAFKFYDLDSDGYLQREEVLSLLEGCDNEEIEYLMNEIDTDRDRKVSLQEFLAYLNRSS